MIVLRNGIKTYYPKLTIRSCLTINELFGDVTAPLMSYMSLETQAFLLSLSLQQDELTEDELYDLMDIIEDLNSLIVELYKEAGLISDKQSEDNLQEQSDPGDSSSEPLTFESHMMDLLEKCMSIGMREEDFYHSTLTQINRYVESYNKQQENQLQEKAYFDYQLAGLIKLAIGGAIDRKVKYPLLKEAYPFLNFDDEKNKKVDEEWELEKQHIKLMEWAEQMNKKFEKNKKE